jgi:N-acetylneuraminic acid mutarotase
LSRKFDQTNLLVGQEIFTKTLFSYVKSELYQVLKMGEQRIALALLLILSLFLPASSLPLVSAAEDSWTTLEPMPTARSGLGVAVVDGKIYAIGGYNGSYLATNEMYDPTTNTWTTKQPMPTARSMVGIAVVQNKIYVFGGVTGPSNFTSSTYTGATEVYDPVTDKWENKTSMPMPRYRLCANVVNDRIYLIGGYDPTKFPRQVNVNQVYDPEYDTWATRTPMPTAAYGYGSTVLDNKIYIIGGTQTHPYRPPGSVLEITLNQIYNPETNTWSSGTMIPMIAGGLDAVATTGELAPKKIYVYCGYTISPTNVTSYFTQVYDPENGMWANGTRIPLFRYGFSVAVVNDELYVIGGKTSDNYLAVNEKYTPIGYIPEFPSWVVLPLFFVATLVGVAVRRKVFRPT